MSVVKINFAEVPFQTFRNEAVPAEELENIRGGIAFGLAQSCVQGAAGPDGKLDAETGWIWAKLARRMLAASSINLDVTQIEFLLRKLRAGSYNSLDVVNADLLIEYLEEQLAKTQTETEVN